MIKINTTKYILKLVYLLRGENVFKYINMYRALEKTGLEGIAKYKKERVQNICKYILDNITYYKKLNISMERRDDLRSFPVLCKSEIRESMAEFMLPHIRCTWRSTSGSTGIPFVFPKDREATAHMDAMMYQVYSWYSIKVGDRQARIWGTKLKFKDKIFEKIKDIILDRKRLSAFHMDDVACFKYYHKLIKYKPKYFYAYTNAMYQFALSLERQNLDGRQLEIPVAICTGEVLFPFQKEKIENILGCKVVNEYGTTENGIIAFQCEYNKLHITPTLVVEIINPDCNGFGNVVVTELNSKVIPFVRYNTGDVARIIDHQCSCGRPYPILELKEGRLHDIIICPDGSVVYASILSYILKSDAIKFKAVQEKNDLLSINIVPGKGFSSVRREKIISDLKKYLGIDMNIIISTVEEIQPEISGKLRYFVSNVNNMQDTRTNNTAKLRQI